MARSRRRGVLETVVIPVVAGSALTAGLLFLLVPHQPAPERMVTAVAEPAPPVGTTVELVDPAARNVTPSGVTSLPDETRQPLRRVTTPRPTGPADTAAAPVMELTQETVYSRLVVLDAGGFRVVVGGKPALVRLAGVTAVPFDELCTTPAGATWKCGARARAELARLIGGRSVACRMVDESDPAAPVADCRVGPRRLGPWLVENGWADPAADAGPEMADLASKALIERRGRYQTDPLGGGSGG